MCLFLYVHLCAECICACMCVCVFVCVWGDRGIDACLCVFLLSDALPGNTARISRLEQQQHLRHGSRGDRSGNKVRNCPLCVHFFLSRNLSVALFFFSLPLSLSLFLFFSSSPFSLFTFQTVAPDLRDQSSYLCVCHPRHNTCVTTLNLKRNQIGDAGAVAMGEGLKYDDCAPQTSLCVFSTTALLLFDKTPPVVSTSRSLIVKGIAT
jgi:hypothetical protein